MSLAWRRRLCKKKFEFTKTKNQDLYYKFARSLILIIGLNYNA